MRLALLLVVLLAGCAHRAPEKMWYRDATSEQEFTRDQGQCQAQAWAGQNVALVFEACMRGKGYQSR